MNKALSFVVFLAVAALVAAALWVGWGRLGPDRGRFVIVIEPGSSVDYGLGPDVGRVRVVSGVVLPDDTPEDARMSMTVPLDVAWVAPNGDVRRAERVWERTRLSRWPGADLATRRPAGVLDDGRRVTDSRSTELPASQILPGGGVLRLSVPEGSAPQVFRVFGARMASDSSAESPKVEELRRAARRAGVPRVALLDREERGSLMDETWRSLPFAATDDDGRLQRLRRDETGLVPREETIAGSILAPGQSVAITVVGPTRVRVDGTAGLDDLSLEAVGDIALEAPAPRMNWVAAQPSRLLGSERALVLELPDPVVTSLVLHNPTNEVLGPFVVSMLDPSREQLHGWTPAAEPERLLGTAPSNWALIGPERVEVPGVRIGPDESEPFDLLVPIGNPVVRLDLRPELDDHADDRPRRAVVAEIGSDGQVLRTETISVSAWPAPFERRSADGGWVGEPVRVELEPRAGARRLRVTADGPMQVMANVEGPPRGRDWYRLDHPEHMRVRYAKDPPQRWWRRWPANLDAIVEAQQLGSVLANVRLEPRGPDAAEGARHYAALRPLDGLAGQGRTWLIPGPGAFGLAWCRYDAGAPSRPFQWDGEARGLRFGELRGVLHTPSRSALGEPFRVELDGAIWRQGRIAQRVERVGGVQEPGHRSARLVGPPGTSLWLRGRAAADQPDCHRGVEAWPLRQGGVARLPLNDTWEGRRFVVSGLADAPVRVEIAIEGLGQPYPGADRDRAFVQEITLRPGEDLGRRLTDPDLRLPVLEPETVRIGAEVQDLVLRIRHIDGPVLWLRTLVEVDSIEPPRAPGSARVRGGR